MYITAISGSDGTDSGSGTHAGHRVLRVGCLVSDMRLVILEFLGVS